MRRSELALIDIDQIAIAHNSGAWRAADVHIVLKNWMLLTLFLSVLFAGAIYWVHGNIEYKCALLRRRILFAPPPEPR